MLIKDGEALPAGPVKMVTESPEPLPALRGTNWVAQLAEIYRMASAARIRVIPLGFDLDPYLAGQPTPAAFRSPLGSEVAVVGWVGRLTAIKAPERFIEAAAGVLQVFPAARFIMVGDGELRESCQQHLRRNGVADRVSLLGWQLDMPRVYAGLDLVVLTSKNEGTPLALLEAMGVGKANRQCGCRRRARPHDRPQRRGDMEVFTNGILIRHPASIASAVCYLLADPQLCDRMGSAGREFVASRFSQHRLARELEGLYLALAQSKGLLAHTQALCNPQRPAATASRRVVVPQPTEEPNRNC